MSEPEKKGSAWPWIAVPVAAVSVFFLLRECQHRLPPAQRAVAPEAAAPAAAEPSATEPAATEPPVTEPATATPEPAPAPQ